MKIRQSVEEAFEEERNYQKTLGISCQVQLDGYANFVFVNRFGNVQHQGTLNKAMRRIIRDCNDEILEKAKGPASPCFRGSVAIIYVIHLQRVCVRQG